MTLSVCSWEVSDQGISIPFHGLKCLVSVEVWDFLLFPYIFKDSPIPSCKSKQKNPKSPSLSLCSRQDFSFSLKGPCPSCMKIRNGQKIWCPWKRNCAKSLVPFPGILKRQKKILESSSKDTLFTDWLVGLLCCVPHSASGKKLTANTLWEVVWRSQSHCNLNLTLVGGFLRSCTNWSMTDYL